MGVSIKVIRKVGRKLGSCAFFRGRGALWKAFACILPPLPRCPSEERGLIGNPYL